MVGLFALMVLDLEVVSLTLKLPEVWGNTSKAAGATQAKQVWSLTTLKLQVVSLTLKLWLKSGVKSGGG